MALRRERGSRDRQAAGSVFPVWLLCSEDRDRSAAEADSACVSTRKPANLRPQSYTRKLLFPAQTWLNSSFPSPLSPCLGLRASQPRETRSPAAPRAPPAAPQPRGALLVAGPPRHGPPDPAGSAAQLRVQPASAAAMISLSLYLLFKSAVGLSRKCLQVKVTPKLSGRAKTPSASVP